MAVVKTGTLGYHHSGYPGQWFDIDCSDRRMSICVSIVEGDTEGEKGDYFLLMLFNFIITRLNGLLQS